VSGRAVFLPGRGPGVRVDYLARVAFGAAATTFSVAAVNWFNTVLTLFSNAYTAWFDVRANC
jgi:hypothetical protein